MASHPGTRFSTIGAVAWTVVLALLLGGAWRSWQRYAAIARSDESTPSVTGGTG